MQIAPELKTGGGAGMKARRVRARCLASGKQRTAGKERRERQEEAAAGSQSWPPARGRHRNVNPAEGGGRSTPGGDRDTVAARPPAGLGARE